VHETNEEQSDTVVHCKKINEKRRGHKNKKRGGEYIFNVKKFHLFIFFENSVYGGSILKLSQT
jgi:hypothetical protein